MKLNTPAPRPTASSSTRCSSPRPRRLDLRDLVDAYAAGAGELDVSDAFDAVEEYLQRIADVQELNLSDTFARAQRALPDWRRQLALRIAAHDSALAAHRALGGQEDRIEQARRAVADVLDGAGAADASDATP